MNKLIEHLIKIQEAEFNYGDFITLKPDAKVQLSSTGEDVDSNVVADGKLWAVDEYFEESGMLNINRVLDPYPGAYCSFVYEYDVVRSSSGISRRK